MVIINGISVIALLAMLIYVICFICRYRIIPQSLSITAEYNGRYVWWQVTICSVMGWLSYWFPTVYTWEEYSIFPLLATIGMAGLSLAGYFSYSPGDEDKRTLSMHKVGSFTGAICISLFYLLCLHNWYILIIMGCCLVLGLLIEGNRYGHSKSNSVIFWEELGLISFIGYDIVSKFVESLLYI